MRTVSDWASRLSRLAGRAAGTREEHTIRISRECMRVANSLGSWILAMTGLLAVQAISTPASALTIKLEFAGGAATLDTIPATGLTVDLLAELSNDFSGQNFISASVLFDSGLTPTLCAQPPGPQSVGGAMWTPATPNCGSGFPGDGGIGGIHPPGTVEFIEQGAAEFGVGTFGTLHLGTITFDALTLGSHTITPFFVPGIESWLDASFGSHSTATFQSATVNVIPEPATGVLVGVGIMSLSMVRRRRA